MVKIGIVIPENFITSSAYFADLFSQISNYFEDPDANFVLSDQSPIIARYLNGHQYRKCTIYHLGDIPKHKIGRYITKGNFTSYAEINASIKEDCDIVIDVSTLTK